MTSAGVVHITFAWLATQSSLASVLTCCATDMCKILFAGARVWNIACDKWQKEPTPKSEKNKQDGKDKKEELGK